MDLTALGLQGCFSSFLAETRSSQSPTATLSDFVIGNFPLCSLAATPFTGLSKVGDPDHLPADRDEHRGDARCSSRASATPCWATSSPTTRCKQPGAPGVNPP